MKFILASTLASAVTALTPNSTPIYGTYPGWIEGKNEGKI